MDSSIAPDDVDILVLSDDIRQTSGFAVNGRLVSLALAQEWTVANASPQASEVSKYERGGDEVWILPCPSEEGMDLVGSKGFNNLVEECQPDVVVSVIDMHMCEYIAGVRIPMQLKAEIREVGTGFDKEFAKEEIDQAIEAMPSEPRFEWVAHLPIDGTPLRDKWGQWLEEIDHPIAMSKFGQQALEDQFAETVPLIPHGVEAPAASPRQSSDFVLGTVNRNQHRKQYPRLIEAWGEFYEQVGRPDDVSFYMHCDWEDDAGWNLDKYVEKYGIEDAVVPYEGKTSRRQLMGLYSWFDVFCSATGGEGFGLTTIEAMSQGCPVVITDYTTSEELVWDGEPSPRGLLVEVETMYDELPQYADPERALVDTSYFADQLVRYYEDEDLAREHGENAQQWVADALSWQKVAGQWVEYFENEVFGGE